MFRRYVIVIWKESPSSKRRALHKCKLDFASWVLIHRLGIDLTFENQLYYEANEERDEEGGKRELGPGKDAEFRESQETMRWQEMKKL